MYKLDSYIRFESDRYDCPRGKHLRKSRGILATVIMTLEQQALLEAKNARGSPRHYESLSDNSARMLGVSVSSSARELVNTSSIQQPDDKPHVHKEFVEGLPIWRAALLVVNSALGAGILNFPQAYAECGGIATAFTIQMVGVFLSCHCGKINKHEPKFNETRFSFV